MRINTCFNVHRSACLVQKFANSAVPSLKSQNKSSNISTILVLPCRSHTRWMLHKLLPTRTPHVGWRSPLNHGWRTHLRRGNDSHMIRWWNSHRWRWHIWRAHQPTWWCLGWSSHHSWPLIWWRRADHVLWRGWYLLNILYKLWDGLL